MKKIFSLLLALAILVAGVSFSPEKASACSCLAGDVNDRVENSDYVFLGKAVVQAKQGDEVVTVFEVEEVWKPENGDMHNFTPVHTTVNDGANCGFGTPEINETYLVYSYIAPGNVWSQEFWTTSCSGTLLEKDAKSDLRKLGNGEEPLLVSDNPYNKDNLFPPGPENPPQTLFPIYDGGNVHQFNTNLGWGMNSEEVHFLQKFLNGNSFRIAQSGPGSNGSETTYFGSLTQIALKKFQDAYKDKIGIDEGTGYFGPATRNYLNVLFGPKPPARPVN